MTRRTERLNHLIQIEISDLLRKHINDPRLNGLISVTAVEISNDLKTARVSISTLGGTPDRDEVLKGFNSAAGYMRRELAHRLNIRVTPELSFEFDDSIEHGVNLVNLIDRVAAEDNKGGADGLKRAAKRK
ncbi:MAG: 30S ribosome-binding factor RbfA [Dehalococcoidia bacterium]|nr:30S ribosome-binding factor RbfA [Dehalococcoidia bacterium]MDD5647370.1 30S ribosome-binding factor RbfA [Dehalococcoidia bacterium]